jgi:predicted transcriptional regulator
MSTGLLSHHLAVLENRGLVRAEADGHRKRYFPANAFAPEERRILAMLRQRVPRRVLSALVEHGLRTFAELQAATEVSKSTLSYHLKKLRRAGLVLEGRAERGKMYGLRDPDVVARLLRVSEERSGDEVDAFAAGWTEMRA